MSDLKTAEDFLPMLSSLSNHERVRLIRLLIQQTTSSDAEAYALMPPGEDEFSSDEEPLAWEAEGWEEFYGDGAKSDGIPLVCPTRNGLS